MANLRTSGVFSLGALGGDVGGVVGDANWGDTVLLMKGDNNLSDETGNHTPTATSAAFSTDRPFVSNSTHSMSFNGTSSGEITLPYSTDFQFGADPFTVEMWVKWDGTTGLNTLFNTYTGAGAGDGIALAIYNGAMAVWVGINGSSWTISQQSGGLSPTASTWHHIALTRQSNNDFELFLDGVQGTTLGNLATYSVWDNSQPAHIGSNGGVFYYNGLIAEVRITKGVARYTTSFNTDPVITSPAAWPTTGTTVAATTRPTRRWGGMLGRSLTTDVDKAPVVDHSLRFDGSGDNLTRTFGTPTNNEKWTLSFWFKRSRTGAREMLFTTPGGTSQLYFEFRADNKLYAEDYVNSSLSNWKLVTNDTFTDNDWHHAVLMLDDSGQGGPATKSKLYIDGVDLSATTPSGLSTHDHTNISSFWNSPNVVHYIGKYYGNNLSDFSGQLAEIHFVDGQALTAADFGETNASGQWVPKEVTGLTYGTNGFHLPLSTPSSTTNAFNAVTYSGTRGTQEVTGVAFQPDFVWLKSRTNTYVSGLFDTVRGGGTHLCSSLTNGNIVQDASGYLNSFDADGFTLIEKPSNTGVAQTWNETGQNYIAWAWKAGGAPTSNGSAMVDGVATTTSSIATAASAGITPTKMSVNTEAGFSIVQYDGTGANTTVPHGLSQTPECVIVKNTDLTNNWLVYHEYMDANPEQKRIFLNLADAKTDSTTPWNDTAPSSSVLTLGTSGYTNGNTNGTAESMIAYCWHSVPGFSKFGSYTGNGVTDGPKVNCGFRPAFLMIKNVSAANSNWIIYDNARNPQTDATKKLGANEAYVENNTTYYGGDSVNIDLLADGFHITATGINHNNSGNTYLYMAFADTSPNLGLDATTDGWGVTLLLDGSSETDVTGLSSIVERGTVTSGYTTNAKFINYTDFDNTTTQDNLKITLPSALGASNEPFTIETWAWFDVLGASGNEGVFQLTPSGTTIDGTTASGGVAAGASLALSVINNQWRVYNEATYVDNLGAVVKENWYHLALTSDGTTLRWFVDGSEIHSIAIASTSVASGGYPNLVVGCYFTQYYGMNGRIEGFRVTKGIARDIASGFSNGTPISGGGWDVSLTNDNTWSGKPQNNFAVNGGITPDDQLLDSPNLRFATLNPNDAASGALLSNANLTSADQSTNKPVRATEAKSSGKWYFEFASTPSSSTGRDHVGVWDVSETLGTNYVGQTTGSWSMFLSNSIIRNNGSDDLSAYADGAYSWATGDVGMVAMDLDNGKLYFGLDGAWFSSGDPVTGTTPAFSNLTGTLAAAATGRDTTTFNFGQDHTFAGALAPLTTPYTDDAGNGEFYYQPPVGFRALTTTVVGSDTALQSTGVISLAEHYQTKLPQ